MEVAQKKSVWNFTLFIIYIRLAGCQVTLTHNSASALADTFICGTNTQFTCTIDPAPGLMSWVKESATLTECAGANDTCVDTTVDNYQFTSNVAVNEFYLTVNPVMFSNAGTFTCSNGASVDDSKTIKIAAVPSAITMTESGTGTITLQATTDCAFPMSNVSIEWYYLKELTDTPQLYTDNGFSPVRTEDSSTCTSGDCTSGVGVSKVVSTVEFDEKGIGGTSAYLQAKMVHKAAPSSDPAVVATTTKKFIIIEATSPTTTDVISTSTSTTTHSTTTSATSTITSSTSSSISITSPSISLRPTSTHSVSSSTSSTTSSSAVMKPATSSSSGNETTVIIISSVGGGLFLVGIVIAIILMLLSQQKKHSSVKHARHHRYHDHDRRKKRLYNQEYPTWQDHGQYNNASYMEYTGMGTKMNPLYVPNRSAYRAEQNYNLGHQIYTRNYHMLYEGYYSNMRPQTDMHSYKQRYYGGRGGYNMVSSTLHRDENNYLTPDYEQYW